MLDLEREDLDMAIRFALPWADTPNGELLVAYKTFPVCAPALARDESRPLRTPADLEHHVLLDFETVLYGRPWYDWQNWFSANRIRSPTPEGRLLFSHYDQVIGAAIDGSGIAIGKLPHLTRHLREGSLIAPFGPRWVASLGGFYLVLARGAAERSAVTLFVEWLKSEVGRDG